MVKYLLSGKTLNEYRHEAGKPTSTTAFSLTNTQPQFNFLGCCFTARLICFLQSSLSVLPGQSDIRRAVFFVSRHKTKTPLTDAANTGQRLTSSKRSTFTVAKKNIPQSRGIVKFPTLDSILDFPTSTHPESSPDSPQPESFNLTLSADIDEARYNVEMLKETIIENGQALLYWQSRLDTLENQIPSIENHLTGQLKTVLAELK